MAMRVMRGLLEVVRPSSCVVSCCGQGVSAEASGDSLVAVVPAVVAARDRAAGPDRAHGLRAQVERGLLPGVEAGGVDVALVAALEASGHRREVLHGVSPSS